MRKARKTSIFFERALIINAFGDHFLTDAFAAGHLINKEVMIDRFKSAFLSGGGLSAAAEKFFDRVADTAWTGELAAKFSKLETVEYPTVHVPWYIALVPGGLPLAGRDVPVPFHPNIDSASRFASVLKEAAKQQPDRVGNLILKALHDYLNEHGIEVTNGAGDGTWMLPGDGTLMVGTGGLTPGNLAKNLGIMRKAVQQSIDDINSPSIRASNLNFQPFFDGVWRYVPVLTSASQKQMAALIRDYSDPASATLVRAAARYRHGTAQVVHQVAHQRAQAQTCVRRHGQSVHSRPAVAARRRRRDGTPRPERWLLAAAKRGIRSHVLGAGPRTGDSHRERGDRSRDS